MKKGERREERGERREKWGEEKVEKCVFFYASFKQECGEAKSNGKSLRIRVENLDERREIVFGSKEHLRKMI